MCSETEADSIVEPFDNHVFTPAYYRAAKSHTCGNCDVEILKGQIFAYITGISEGVRWNTKFCHDCDHDRNWLNYRGHSWMVGIITSDYDFCRKELAG